MAVEVWWGSGSTPAWRVLLGFAVEQVPYTSHLLSFSAGEVLVKTAGGVYPGLGG